MSAPSPEKAHVFRHPYLGIIAACRECGKPDQHLMLEPAGRPEVAWDQGDLSTANDVARAHMRERHAGGPR